MNTQIRYFFLPLALLLFLVAGCGLIKDTTSTPEKSSIREGTKVTGAELLDLLNDNTISLHEYGETATIEMYSNGKMYAVKSKTEKNDGRWSTENDRLCLKFMRWGFGDEICYDVFRKGEEYHLYTESGIRASYFTVNPGVKRGPADKKSSATRKRSSTRATTSPDVVVEEQPAKPVSTPTIQESNQTASPQAASRDLGMIYRGMSQNCPGCNLQGANLAEASLLRANLAGANLSNATLVKANLKWANLKGANLTSADLSGANLAGADLAGANLERADLTGANLEQANLRGATITGAIGLDLKKAIR
ncbi:pentapeptide repeat-containing protein [Thiovibrio frasassiensis]|uniref:Pentapeptide repeat-containing protein n=1 Tax=Thiovibrio frasassiensis TaxID=2984131 RepID=A0A9X4MEC7_9BACT|nr:pentapeptide repeat-containing protein [Thiovibrio frasassiensis]MDG4475032.1 pentapeptide repeat-containing protein [Thiovibrio frasassiensis]